MDKKISIERRKILFGNLANGHFEGKFLLLVSTWGHTGSNDTSLKSLSCPGAEPKNRETNKQTFEYYKLY
jgi:hypothetical protein